MWVVLLDDGRGGWGDYGKYRDRLYGLLFEGKMPEKTAEERVADAKAAVGKAPAATVAEARALFDRLTSKK